MSDMKQVLLCGLGGQGVVMAGRLLGGAAFSEGKRVSGTSSYGAAARGGECRSEVLISDAPIAFPFLTMADVLVAAVGTRRGTRLDRAHGFPVAQEALHCGAPVRQPER